MTIELTPESDRIVASKLSVGGYASAGEVVSEALLLLEQRDAAARDEFRRELEDRLEGPDRDVEIDADEVWAHFEQRARERRARMTA